MKDKKEFEELAKRFTEAITKLTQNENNLNNLQYYLSRHFEQWLKKFANNPQDIVWELEQFAKMEF